MSDRDTQQFPHLLNSYTYLHVPLAARVYPTSLQIGFRSDLQGISQCLWLRSLNSLIFPLSIKLTSFLEISTLGKQLNSDSSSLISSCITWHCTQISACNCRIISYRNERRSIYARTSLTYTLTVLMEFRYASRVRAVRNDPKKNVSSKERLRLKKLLAYWKEKAGRKDDDEDLEEIQEERSITE